MSQGAVIALAAGIGIACWLAARRLELSKVRRAVEANGVEVLSIFWAAPRSSLLTFKGGHYAVAYRDANGDVATVRAMTWPFFDVYFAKSGLFEPAAPDRDGLAAENDRLAEENRLLREELGRLRRE